MFLLLLVRRLMLETKNVLKHLRSPRGGHTLSSRSFSSLAGKSYASMYGLMHVAVFPRPNSVTILFIFLLKGARRGGGVAASSRVVLFGRPRPASPPVAGAVHHGRLPRRRARRPRGAWVLFCQNHILGIVDTDECPLHS